MKYLIRIILPISILALTACSDYGLEDPTEAPVISTGSGVIGTLGGIVFIGDETSPAFNSFLVIPEGTLTTPAEFSVSATNLSLPGDPKAKVVQFQPKGKQFDSAVFIGLSYAHYGSADPNKYKIVHYDPDTGDVEDLPSADADLDAYILYATTTHFSYFALMEKGGGGEVTYGEFIDYRNNQTYRTVEIGSQTWLAENLNYQGIQGACYDNNSNYCTTFGYLYTWENALKACPNGWRLPSDQDWSDLELFLGADPQEIEYDNEYRGGQANVGGKLKDTKLWKSPNTDATNETGFSALPGEMRQWDGSFADKINDAAYFWTSTTSTYRSDLAYFRRLDYENGATQKDHIRKDVSFSVRCLKN